MNPGDAARILAKAAAYDQRTIGEADAMAWFEALSDLDAADALEAVTRHYRGSTERLMPAHVRVLVAGIVAEQRHAAFEERREAERCREVAAAPTRDRSPEVLALVRRVRDVELPPGRPGVFQRREWFELEQARARAGRAVPNPEYVGPPPPGGWPVPDVSVVDDPEEGETA